MPFNDGIEIDVGDYDIGPHPLGGGNQVPAVVNNPHDFKMRFQDVPQSFAEQHVIVP